MKAIIKTNNGTPETIEITYNQKLPTLEIEFETAMEIIWELFYSGEKGLHEYLKDRKLI